MYKLFIFLLFFPLFNFGQEYCFPLYFEDAAGNRDTLYFGFDKNASTGMDTALGEVNIIGEPYDSSLFVFFTNATSYDENMDDCRLAQTKDPTFVSKYQIINDSYDPIEIGMISKNWPITISWNESDINGWDINDFFNYEKLMLIMTCCNPPGGWFDALCCGGGWPDYYTIMANSGQLSLEQNTPCHYNANYTNDSISLLFIGVVDYLTGIENHDAEKVYFSYNYEWQTLYLHNDGIAKEIDLTIVDASGRTILKESFDLSPGVKRISIDNQPPGLYVITATNHKNNQILNTQKINTR